MNERLIQFTRGVSVIIIIGSMLVAAGWFFDAIMFGAEVQIAVVASFFICALSLILQTIRSSRFASLGRALALAVVVINFFLFTDHLLKHLPPELITNWVLFIFTGMSLACSGRGKYCVVARVLNLIVAIVALFNVYGALYGSYESGAIWVKYFETGIVESLLFMLMSAAIIAFRRDEWILDPVMSRMLGGVMARRFVPLVFLFMFLAWLRLKGEMYGFYDLGFGLTLTIFVATLIMVFSVLFVARKMNALDEMKERGTDALMIFRSLVDAANEEIFIIDAASGAILDVNGTVSELTGYSREELLLMNVVDIEGGIEGFTWDRHVASLRNMEKTTLCGGHRRKDGTIIPVEINIRLVKVRSREFVIAFARDITERKKAETALHESEETLRVMTENAKDAIIMIDDEGKVSFWNRAAENILGYSRMEIMGKNCHQIIAPKKYHGAYEGAFPHFKLTGEGGVIGKTLELEAVRKNGEIFPIELSVAGIKFKGKWHAVGIMRDITERKRTESELLNYQKQLERMIKEREGELKEDEKKYREILENANDPIVVTNADTGEILLVNHAAERFFGRSQNELVGAEQTILYPADKKEHYRKRFKEAVLQRSIVVRDVTVVTSSGKEIPVQISCSKVFWQGQKIVQGIFSDVSEYKKIEAGLAKELENAKRLSDIGALAATVAHELRNPLGVIRTAAYNIDRKAKDPDLSKHIANIDKKILESDRIIKNLLTYSRIKQPQLEQLAPIRLIDECVRECREKYKGYDIKFTRDYRCGMDDPMMADSLHMAELFTNILDNACQSLLEKRGTVDITAEMDRQKGLFRLVIKDDGEGIAPADMPKLFEPFFTKKSKGVGLGLTVCQQVVGLHNGRIDIKSEKGVGSIVTVELPIGNV